ncbi:MAG: hypothetical protein H0U71_07815 [Gammaproteobacteria bacterium]|nr:hypothetical protein [Gammaproteobacteria bacterium]
MFWNDKQYRIGLYNSLARDGVITYRESFELVRKELQQTGLALQKGFYKLSPILFEAAAKTNFAMMFVEGLQEIITSAVDNKDVTRTISGVSGGITGAVMGGEIGLEIGATVGAIFPPAELVTIPVGAAVGSVVGGYMWRRGAEAEYDDIVQSFRP